MGLASRVATYRSDFFWFFLKEVSRQAARFEGVELVVSYFGGVDGV